MSALLGLAQSAALVLWVGCAAVPEEPEPRPAAPSAIRSTGKLQAAKATLLVNGALYTANPRQL